MRSGRPWSMWRQIGMVFLIPIYVLLIMPYVAAVRCIDRWREARERKERGGWPR